MHGVAGPLPEAGWGVGFRVWEPLRWEWGEGGGPGGGLRTAPFKAPRSQQPGGSSRRLSWGLLCTRPGPLCPVHEAHRVQLRRRTPVAAWGGGGWRAVSSTEADRVPARAGSQALTGTSVAVNAGHAGLPWCPSWAYLGPSGQGHPARTGQLARCAEVRETPPLPLRLSGWRLGPWSGDGGATRWRGAGPPDTCGPRQGPFPWPQGCAPGPQRGPGRCPRVLWQLNPVGSRPAPWEAADAEGLLRGRVQARASPDSLVVTAVPAGGARWKGRALGPGGRASQASQASHVSGQPRGSRLLICSVRSCAACAGEARAGSRGPR